jgi:hypothetical protein
VKARENAVLFVEIRQPVQFGVSARRGNGHRAEGVQRADADQIGSPPYPFALLSGGRESELELFKPEFARDLGDFFA